MKTTLVLMALATLAQSEVELGEQRMRTHRIYWAKSRACSAALERAREACARSADAGAQDQCRAKTAGDLLNCNEAARTWRNRELARLGSPRRYDGTYR